MSDEKICKICDEPIISGNFDTGGYFRFITTDGEEFFAHQRCISDMVKKFIKMYKKEFASMRRESNE
ncbi:MAG: hypothetical protein ACTSUO_00860 [Candidatus Thorarchaeota archaeon]